MMNDSDNSSFSEERKWQRNKRAFDKWNTFLEQYPDTRLFDHIEQFFSDHVAATLDATIIEQLEKYESTKQRDNFMSLLGQQIQHLDWFSRNYLYYKWIRMAALDLYTESERDVLKKIPLLPYPAPMESFARTISLNSGHIILISFGFSMVALSVFQSLLKDGISNMTANEVDSYYHHAADDILAHMKVILNGADQSEKLTTPTATASQVYAGDLLNNQLHTFVLLHEYNHILLDHIDRIQVDPSQPVAKEQMARILKRSSISGAKLKDGYFVLAEKSASEKDIEADYKSLELLVKPPNSRENQLANMFLASSIFVYHHLQMIAKAILGFSKKSFEMNETRMNMALSYIKQQSAPVQLFKECAILKIALEKTLKE